MLFLNIPISKIEELTNSSKSRVDTLKKIHSKQVKSMHKKFKLYSSSFEKTISSQNFQTELHKLIKLVGDLILVTIIIYYLLRLGALFDFKTKL